MERYDRNSIVGLSMPTVNPCNNFIIDYLIRTKIKSDKQVSSKYYMYNLAIQSVRKYPLPLICEQQLAALQGFGNFFIKRVAKLMKKHYQRGRMPTQEEMDEDDRDHLEGIRENLRRLNQAKKQKQEEEQRQKNQYDSKKKEQDSDQSQNNYSNNHQQSADQFQKSSNQQLKKQQQKSIDEKSSKSKSQLTLKFQKIMNQKRRRDEPQKQKQRQRLRQKQKQKKSQADKIKQNQRRAAIALKKKRNYRPRRGTQPYQILKAIIQLQNQGKKPVLKGDINQYMFNIRKQKMKGWTPVRDRLVQFGYLTSDKQNQDLVTITQKGKDYFFDIQKYGSEQQDSQSKSKSPKNRKDDSESGRSGSSSMISKSKSRSRSRSPVKSRTQQQSLASSKKKDKKSSKRSIVSYSNSSYTKTKQRKLAATSSSRFREKIRYRPQQKIQKIQLVPGRLYKDPILLYNQKSQINRRDQERIADIMNKLPDHIKFRQDQLSIGQFAWEIGDNLLDYLVLRVKCDNFDLDQYFLLCQRIKHSQCDNCYIVFQDSLFKAKGSQGKENLINSVIADSRVAGFKIIRTSGIQQTFSMVTKMTVQLSKKVKITYTTYTAQTPKLQFISSRKQFNERTSHYKPTLVRNVAVNCLRCIPNISREMIKKLLKRMPGMWYIYLKLNKLRSDSERKKFLLWYLKDCGPRKGTIRLIVDLMFFTDYND